MKMNRHKFVIPLFDVDASICQSFIDKKVVDRTKFVLDHQVSLSGKEGVHLIFEGVSNSDDCLGGLLFNFSQIFKDVLKKDKRPIKAITCSNFHSVFGFLLSLDKDIETIRKEMYKLKFVVHTLEEEKKTI